MESLHLKDDYNMYSTESQHLEQVWGPFGGKGCLDPGVPHGVYGWFSKGQF